MGFRTGAFAKVWEVNPTSDTTTKLKLSISRKNKQTNEFETEWNGFALVVGIMIILTAGRISMLLRRQLFPFRKPSFTLPILWHFRLSWDLKLAVLFSALNLQSRGAAISV